MAIRQDASTLSRTTMNERTANVDSSGFKHFRQRGGLWVAAQFGLMLGIGIAGWAPPSEPIGPGANAVAGVLFLAGAGIGIWGTWNLGSNRTAYPEPVVGGRLIQKGAYAWVRHPLYICLLLLGLSWSVWRWNVLAAVTTGVLGLLLDWKARREEHRLREVYPDYAEYQRRVKRFIPGIY